MKKKIKKTKKIMRGKYNSIKKNKFKKKIFKNSKNMTFSRNLKKKKGGMISQKRKTYMDLIHENQERKELDKAAQDLLSKIQLEDSGSSNDTIISEQFRSKVPLKRGQLLPWEILKREERGKKALQKERKKRYCEDCKLNCSDFRSPEVRSALVLEKGKGI